MLKWEKKMSEEVNLLKQPKIVTKEKNILLILSLLFLLLTIAVTVIMLVFSLYLKNEEGALIDRQAENAAILNEFQDKKVMYQSTKERVLAVAQLLQEKDIFTDRFLEVSSAIPQNVSISVLDMEGNAAKMVLLAESLSPLNTFIEEGLPTLPEKPELGIRRIQIDSVGVQKDAKQYSVGVTIEFN